MDALIIAAAVFTAIILSETIKPTIQRRAYRAERLDEMATNSYKYVQNQELYQLYTRLEAVEKVALPKDTQQHQDASTPRAL